MPWNLKNVALEAAYSKKRAVAAKMDMEPVIAGLRLRMGKSITISDELYEINKARIIICVVHGVLTATFSEDAKKSAPAEIVVPSTEETSEEESTEETSEIPKVEASGAGWYVIKLKGVEVDKVRGKVALQEWMTKNGYSISDALAGNE